MIFFVFGKFCIRNVPSGKKSTFVPKIGGFSSRKRFSNFFFLFFKLKLRQNNFFEFWNIWDSECSNWKKIHFCPENLGYYLIKKFSDFAQNLLICSSDKKKFNEIWNKFENNFGKWKKIHFLFSRSDKFTKDFQLKFFLAGISFINWAERIYKGFLS